MAKKTKVLQVESDKAVIVSSLSLSQRDWNYLRLLAMQLSGQDGGYRRPTTSLAVRHLIEQDRARRATNKRGDPVFQVGAGQAGVLNMSTGTTSVQTSGDVIDLSGPKKKGPGR